ncbi:hypothetical protein EV130_111213 [Rhizobium azibense]|uniref:Uncharacterized protein n=1 Tax=Rhizobium azibense TaxID=1136135 RepID=A0A4R3QS67_9HYPH|nr:hypothetical protein [Rhizobium azibense]TCU21356.1 hypothetical protein EV130_111213 [Rhizobium azibense]
MQALVASLSQDVYYEPGLIVAEGDFVAIHGRIRGWANVPQVVIDLFPRRRRQDEVPVTAARGGVPMFDPEEGTLQAQLATS